MFADDIEGFLKYLENVTFQLACLLNAHGPKKHLQASKRTSSLSLTGVKRPRSTKTRAACATSELSLESPTLTNHKRVSGDDINGVVRNLRGSQKKLKGKRKARQGKSSNPMADIDLLSDLNLAPNSSASSLIERQASTELLIEIESKPQLSGNLEHGVHLTPNGISPVTLSDLTSSTNSLIVGDTVGQLGLCSDELAPMDPHGNSISPLETTLAQFHTSIQHHHHHPQQNQHAHYFAMPRNHLDSYVHLQEDFSAQDLPINSLNQHSVSPNQLHLHENSRNSLCQIHQQGQQDQQTTGNLTYAHQQHVHSSSIGGQLQSQPSHQLSLQSHLRPHHQSPLLIHISQHPVNTNQLNQQQVGINDGSGSGATTSDVSTHVNHANTGPTMHDPANHYHQQLDQQWLSGVTISHATETSLLSSSDPNNLDHVVPLSPATHQSLEQVQFSAPLYSHQSYYASQGDQLDSFQHVSSADEFSASSSNPIISTHQRQTIQGQVSHHHRDPQRQQQSSQSQLTPNEQTNSGSSYDPNETHRSHDHQQGQSIQGHHQNHQMHQHNIGQQIHYLTHSASQHQHHQQQLQSQSMPQQHQHYHHQHLGHHSNHNSQLLPVINSLEPVNGVILQDINLASATWSSPEDLYSI